MNIYNQRQRWLSRLTVQYRVLGYLVLGIALFFFVTGLSNYLEQNPLTVSHHTIAQPYPKTAVKRALIDDQTDTINRQTKQLVYQQDAQYQKTALKPRISVASINLNDESEDLKADAEGTGSRILNRPITSSGGLGGYNGILIALIHNTKDDSYHATVVVRPYLRSIITDDWVQDRLENYQSLINSDDSGDRNQAVQNIMQDIHAQLSEHYFHQTASDLAAKAALQQQIIISGIVILLWVLLNCFAMTDLTVDCYGQLLWSFGKQKQHYDDDLNVFAKGVILAIFAEETVRTVRVSSGSGSGFGGGGGDFGGFSGGDGGGFI